MMLLRSIRSRLIGLVLASVVPFIALISVGLWNLWRTDQKAAFERSITEARVIAGQVDDHIGNVRNLMAGLSVAVSWDPKDIDTNDRLLHRVKAELPPYISSIQLFALDGTNIGTSSEHGTLQRERSRLFPGYQRRTHARGRRSRCRACRQGMDRRPRAADHGRQRQSARRARHRHPA